MKLYLTIFSMLFCPVCFAEQLPKDSASLLEKLSDFEVAEQKKLDQLIQEKRVQVANILEQHLERETKAGNLDGALVLKSEIRRLKKDAKPNGGESEAEMAPKSLVSTIWTGTQQESNLKVSVEFISDSKVNWQYGSYTRERVWEKDRRNSIRIGNDENSLEITFEFDLAKGTGLVTLHDGSKAEVTLEAGANRVPVTD